MENNTNAGAGHAPEQMTDEEFNTLLIETVPERYWPIITEGITKPVVQIEGQPPIMLPMKPEDRVTEAKNYLDAIVIAGPEDTKSYKLIESALKGIVKWRTSIEKKRKELKRVALDYGKAVDGEAARLTKLVEDVENPAKAKLEAIDNIIEEQRKAEQLRRHNLITSNEWVIMGSFYVCGVHNIMMEELHTCSAERLEEIVAIGQQEKLRKEAEAKRKADEEARAKAEAERIRLENEELKAKLAAVEAAKPAPQPEPFNEGTPFALMAPAPPRMFEGHPRPQGFKVPAAIPTDAALGSAIFEPEEETPFDRRIVLPVTAFDYGKGFEECRTQVIALLTDPTPRTRAQFIELINALKPTR